MSAQSLRDYYPEANITLYTHEKFLDKRCEDLFDEVRVGIPISRRSKMWCMARTPYNITLYNDVDSLVLNKNIKHVFNQLDDGYDAKFGPSHGFEYTISDLKLGHADKLNKWPIKHHGAFCIYRRSMLEFHQTWFDEYIKQENTKWPYGDWAYPLWKNFDMFTLWRLVHLRGDKEPFEHFKHLNIGLLPRHWNSSYLDIKEDLQKPPVVKQINKEYLKNLKYFTDNYFVDKKINFKENYLNFN